MGKTAKPTAAQQKAPNERILWIDLFRALAIICVLMGHITGKLSIYIYQFHMAAFFFISGYCTNWYKSGKLRIVWNRLCSLMLPLAVLTAAGACIFKIMAVTGVYGVFFGDAQPFIGGFNILKNFVFHSRQYVWLLGAGWFAGTLFNIVIIHALLTHFFDIRKPGQRAAYLLVSFGIYATGFAAIQKGGDSELLRDCMGQLYFALGCSMKYYSGEISEGFRKAAGSLPFRLAGLAASSAAMRFFSAGSDYIVDYPDLSTFSNILQPIAALNGILWLYFLSGIIEYAVLKLKDGGLKKVAAKLITVCGGNTMSVMLLHFASFKLSGGILVLAGVIGKDYLREFIPVPDDIGWRFAWLYIIIALVFSIGVWSLLTRIPFVRFFFGASKESYNKIFALLDNRKFFRALCARSERLTVSRLCEKTSAAAKAATVYEKAALGAIAALWCSLTYTVVRQGVILNDELQAYNRRFHGLAQSLKDSFAVEMAKGRPLRIMASLNYGLSFTIADVYKDRFFQCAAIGVMLYCLYLFAKEVFSKRTAYTAVLVFLIFYPLSFEHGAPNAFIGMTVVPMTELLIALIWFVKYLKSEKKRFLAASALIWTAALCGYEFVVTYTPLFLILYGFFGKEKSFADMVKKCFTPGIIGVVYVAATVILQRFVESNYTGVQMSFSDPAAIVRVLLIISVSSLPGVLPFMSKYTFFTEYYKDYADRDLLISGIVPVIAVGAVLLLIGTGAVNIRTGLREEKKSAKRTAAALLSAALYAVLPALPNSVTTLYQESVTFSWFNWLPVSTFLFAASCLLIAYAASLVSVKSLKGTCLVLGGCICAVGGRVQYSNKIVSERSNENFERIYIAWDALETDTVSRLDGFTIYSSDMFETRELLAEHDGYWDQFLDARGRNLTLNRADENTPVPCIYAALPVPGQLSIAAGNDICVFSKKPLNTWITVADQEKKYHAVYPGASVRDNGLYVYGFTVNDGTIQPADPSSVFAGYNGTAGSTLNTVIKEYGFEPDGWVLPSAQCRIMTKDNGTITLSIFYPEYSPDRESVLRISCDGAETAYTLTDVLTCITLNTAPNTECTLDLNADFRMNDTGTDQRELCYVLSDIVGE